MFWNIKIFLLSLEEQIYLKIYNKWKIKNNVGLFSRPQRRTLRTWCLSTWSTGTWPTYSVRTTPYTAGKGHSTSNRYCNENHPWGSMRASIRPLAIFWPRPIWPRSVWCMAKACINCTTSDLEILEMWPLRSKCNLYRTFSDCIGHLQ